MEPIDILEGNWNSEEISDWNGEKHEKMIKEFKNQNTLIEHDITPDKGKNLAEYMMTMPPTQFMIMFSEVARLIVIGIQSKQNRFKERFKRIYETKTSQGSRVSDRFAEVMGRDGKEEVIDEMNNFSENFREEE